jgi:hypothetical protein
VVVRWLVVGETALVEPFFPQTFARFVTGSPAAGRATTDLQELLDRGAEGGRRKPQGFIFHMSRCGSTVVANALRALRRSRVIAEARPLNQILGAPIPTGGQEYRIALIRAVAGALGGRAPRDPTGPSGEESGAPYFVKFSSWNVLYLPLIRAAFPGVPSVFVYRHPVEVMVANQSRGGSWMRAWSAVRRAPAAVTAVTGVDGGELADLTPEAYCARVLGSFCRAALESPAEGRLFVNHRDLSPAILPTLLTFFRADADEEERALMECAMRLDAKDPERRRLFTDDSAVRQAAASDSIRALAHQWAMGPYERLERLRAVR